MKNVLLLPAVVAPAIRRQFIAGPKIKDKLCTVERIDAKNYESADKVFRECNSERLLTQAETLFP